MNGSVGTIYVCEKCSERYPCYYLHLDTERLVLGPEDCPMKAEDCYWKRMGDISGDVLREFIVASLL